MIVDPRQPFKLIYSLYQHQYLGFLFESFAVQLNSKGNLTYTHQNISSKNAKEFSADENDLKLIESMDSMQQELIANHFSKKKVKSEEFFLKVYDKQVGDKLLQSEIDRYVENRRAVIMPLLYNKNVFEMGPDGEPSWHPIKVLKEKATVLFHFRRNDDNTHYFPTVKLNREKLNFREVDSYIIAKEPGWMMVDNQLFTFEKAINGSKLKPFLKKKFILIPKEMEETYFRKFVAPLVASFDVYAKGFDINTKRHDPIPTLTISEVKTTGNNALSLFDKANADSDMEDRKVLLELSYRYGSYSFKADQLKDVSVNVEKNDDQYVFHRIQRLPEVELGHLRDLEDKGLPLKNSRVTLPQSKAFEWLNTYQNSLKEKGYNFNQVSGGKQYFLGESVFELKISEGIDWFDIKAIVRFGEFEIPFTTIRKLIQQKKSEITLPNGEIGIIPSSWIETYGDLFEFSIDEENGSKLEKHHLSLVRDLQEGSTAKVSMSAKLEKLIDAKVEDHSIPENFKGELRPYQKAGYNWMVFLHELRFGGCLADDMGLGKTVQTLALLQWQAEVNPNTTSLLIMPTSLIYNWQKEALKFTPKLKIYNYTGSNRDKNIKKFSKYDIVITSYGITRIDSTVLQDFYFNYVILDESQAIKNPDSNISKCVRDLKSQNKLILTGTPIENSTLDLWSQFAFANPGLLGSKTHFQKNFQTPIEKRQDQAKSEKLNAIIKPFLLRREKTQVATDLPEKIISVRYCSMSESQKQFYETEKNAFRNHILDKIEVEGLKKSQMILLQGLTKLRQIANHPLMVDENYEGDSGKLEEITYMIENGLAGGHSILVFSQFVKHLSIVKNYLQKQNVPFAYLDGSTTNRKAEVEKFQESKDINIFLISLKAGGLGLNLTKADYVFLLDPWWNPAVEAQAIDRAHRIGQQNKVLTYKFIAKDTLEEKILALQESKMKIAQDIITVEESFVKSLTATDIRKLFS